jgi:hypothetical protein
MQNIPVVLSVFKIKQNCEFVVDQRLFELNFLFQELVTEFGIACLSMKKGIDFLKLVKNNVFQR